MCVLTPFWSAPPSHVYIEGNKSERKKTKQHGCQQDCPSRVGQIILFVDSHRCPTCATRWRSGPKSTFSSQKPLYHHYVSLCIFLLLSPEEAWKTVCSHVLCLLLPKRLSRLWADGGQLMYSTDWVFFFSWSHWSNMNFLCSRSRPHCQDMGRSPQLESCECVFLLCVWMLHSCFHLSVWCCRRASSVRWPHPPCLCWAVKILMMVTQAECWDYVVLFWWLFFFSFQHGQGVVSPSVYVNSCHTKKSHINSKRHNKLLLWDNSAVCCCFHPTMQIFCASHLNDFRCTIPGLDVRGSSCTMATTEKSRFLQ